MPLILPGNVGSATAATGYNVANSVRFNGANHDLRIAPGSVSNRRTMTISFWTKRSNLGGNGSGLIAGWGDGYEGGFASMIYFNDSDQLEIDHDIAGADYNFHSDMLFRDVSAWYHIVIAIDTTQGTESNRQKIYVNGTQITLTETALGFPPENFDTFFNNTLTVVGSSGYEGGSGAVPEYSGYFSEFVMIDGTALAPDQFGEFDSDSNIWKPIDVSGLTFGTNGFYLEFKESGTSQNASGLGADTSGNTNHLAVTALTATDQSTDTCTNNFPTMNSLDNFYAAATFAEGNLQVTTGNSMYSYNTATIGVATGKWYWEGKWSAQNTGSTNQVIFGIAKRTVVSATVWLGSVAWTYGYQGSTGHVHVSDGNATNSTSTTYSVGDIISVAMDLDNNKIHFAKNGTYTNSSDPAGNSGGVAITAADSTSGDSGFYFPAFGDGNANLIQTGQLNFGSPIHAISSGNADGNGYGNFEYAVPSGFFALCTKNLAENG